MERPEDTLIDQNLDNRSNSRGLDNSFHKTNLDLENSLPSGGPNNFPEYNHQQRWTPRNEFVDAPSGFIRGEGNLQNTFNQTSLDLENRSPLGGPINIAYSAQIGTETRNFNTTQPYTPQNTYLNSIKSEDLQNTIKQGSGTSATPITDTFPGKPTRL